jgi:cytochrome c oxidase subunit II
LSSPPSSAVNGRRRTGVRLGVVLAAAGLVVSGCDARELYESSLRFGIPEPISDQAQNIHDLYLGSNAAAVVVGIFMIFLIMFSAIRYRKRSDELPRQVRYNLPIEVLYTVVPFVIIAVLFYYTVLSQNYVNDLSDENGGDEASEIIDVQVTGFQWNWEFAYPNEGVRVIGETDRPAQLVLPTDTTIRFRQSSPDVIHSFWVPEWLFKRDVIPGRGNTFELTLRKEGEFIGRCAELCGEKHAFMNFSLKVVSPQEYESHIADLKADPNAAYAAPAGSSS